jgi:hypothetical protein
VQLLLLEGWLVFLYKTIKPNFLRKVNKIVAPLFCASQMTGLETLQQSRQSEGNCFDNITLATLPSGSK